MRDELLGYYERELTFLRQMGKEFAEKYPKIASRLLLEPDKCEDPHVERMLEGFAFLASRVHLKLDDEFPQLTEALLDVLYPHFLAPVPSLSIVQFLLDPERANLQAGHTIPRGSTLASPPVRGTPCRFRTAYPVSIWPVEVSSVRFELPPPASPYTAARTVLRLGIRSLGGLPLSELKEKVSEIEEHPFARLRFFLHGEAKMVHALYEHLFNNTVALELEAGPKDARVSVPLPLEAIRPVGFEKDEGLLPYTSRSFLGYRLVQEFFTFPEKFLFFDVAGLDAITSRGAQDSLDIVFFGTKPFPLEKSVNAQTFRLNAAPIVNLFSQLTEPIKLTRLQTEYRVIPDVRRQSAHEVYAIEKVTSTIPNLEKTLEYQPFYSFRHGVDRDKQKHFWYASRRASQRADDDGTEVYLTFVDLDFNPALPSAETITVHTTCSNRDLPGDLPFGGVEGDFQLEGPGVYTGIRCLVKPTPSKRIPLRRGAQWRLISHLSLNYLSLVEQDASGGPEALQEILKLYDFADSSVTRQQIAGISKVGARRVLRSVGPSHASFVRGLELSVEFDESQFIGTGVYLFASVLERFLALYASLNSFTQVVASTKQREGTLKRFPPRAGDQIVL